METIQDVKEKVANANPQKKEGSVARTIGEQTARIPSDILLWASVGVMAVSLGYKMFRKDESSTFLGLWAPAFLLFGIYNKLVKELGHDSQS